MTNYINKKQLRASKGTGEARSSHTGGKNQGNYKGGKKHKDRN